MSDDTETMPSARDDGRVRVLVVTEGNTQMHAVPSAGAVVVGRSRSADITIDDPSISREHARIELSTQTVFTDLGSSNGSWVRGKRVEPHVAVTVGQGELLELGTVVLIVQDDRNHEDEVCSIRIEIPPDRSTMDMVRQAAGKAALHGLNVLIQGETGVGKGVIAREIHRRSPRSEGPFVVVDCTAVAPDLAENELFGHEQGAFTGAGTPKPGLLETADGGTAFLDEIGDLDARIQAKLLRAIEERTVRRVGSVAERTIDVRFVAATHRDLDAAAARGTFRKDLLYRLNPVVIEIPPLRARRAEVVPLGEQFLTELARDASCPTLTPEAKRWLTAHDWPGNVRELRNTMERAFATASDGVIDVEHVRREGQPRVASVEAERTERDRIIVALEQCAGNQTKAAALLGISRRTFIYRLDLYGLPRPRKGRSR